MKLQGARCDDKEKTTSGSISDSKWEMATGEVKSILAGSLPAALRCQGRSTGLGLT